MSNYKLKPIKWSMIVINATLFVVIFFSAFALVRAAVTEQMADRISGIIYLVITAILLAFWFKTKAILILPGLLMNLSIAIYFFIHIRFAVILINVILLIISCYMVYVHLKHHVIYRKILELAARKVIDTRNGYTPRYYSVSQLNFSKGELFGFAEYLKRQKIAVPYREDNAVVFVLAEDWFGYFYDLHGGYEKVTRIIFRYDGNVSTFIAKTDYLKFKESLTFDQLCASLGSVFVDFMQHFQQGEIVKIQEKIK